MPLPSLPALPVDGGGVASQIIAGKLPFFFFFTIRKPSQVILQKKKIIKKTIDGSKYIKLKCFFPLCQKKQIDRKVCNFNYGLICLLFKKMLTNKYFKAAHLRKNK